jgi:phenylpyruvate tautomerase PptA (4-oxalocrotonate tautomerase family)
MPLLSITTNCEISTQADELPRTASRLIAESLGKPERYVMVSLQHNPHMTFAGTRDPLVYLELKSIGLPENKTADLSAALCGLMQKKLGIPADRVYIEFSNAKGSLWGWNNSTF